MLYISNKHEIMYFTVPLRIVRACVTCVSLRSGASSWATSVSGSVCLHVRKYRSPGERRHLSGWSRRKKLRIMEFVAAKKSKTRKRKRNTKNKRRVARKLEVKAAARRKIFHHNTSAMRSEPRSHTMEAKAFWENYKVAQDWQQRYETSHSRRMYCLYYVYVYLFIYC